MSRSSTRRTTARTHAGGDTGFVLTRSFAGLLATIRELLRGVSGALRPIYESMRLLARFHQMLPRVADYPWRRDHPTKPPVNRYRLHRSAPIAQQRRDNTAIERQAALTPAWRLTQNAQRGFTNNLVDQVGISWMDRTERHIAQQTF